MDDLKIKAMQLFKSENDLFNTANHIHDLHIKLILKSIDDCLTQVLSQCLGRKAVLGDAKRLTLFKKEGSDYDLLAFDGVYIGALIISNDIANVSVRFDPEIKNF